MRFIRRKVKDGANPRTKSGPTARRTTCAIAATLCSLVCLTALASASAAAQDDDGQLLELRVGGLRVSAVPGLNIDISSAPPPPTLTETFDEQLQRLANAVPEFGGFYVNEDTDTLFVYLTQDLPGVKDNVVRLLRAAFGLTSGDLAPGTAPRSYSRTVVLRAQYPFSQLKQWHDRMAHDVLATPGVVMTDIEDTKNRLLVGVESLASKSAVETALTRAGVAREAVDIEVRPAMQPYGTNNDRIRPVVGGIQTGGPGACTMGPIANRGGVMGFVTNSHCTQTAGGVEGTRFYQPQARGQKFLGRVGTDINDLGTETVDPPWDPNLATSASLCPKGRVCRFSDAAFVRFSSSPSPPMSSPSLHRHGHVAVPPGHAYNSTEYNGDTVQFDEVRNPWTGLTMWKEGRTTGLTWGNVRNTCANENQAGTNRTLFCQIRADVLSGPGDSGSPAMTASTHPYAKLSGVLWGGASGVSSFSPIPNVVHYRELGGMYFCASYRC